MGWCLLLLASKIPFTILQPNTRIRGILSNLWTLKSQCSAVINETSACKRKRLTLSSAMSISLTPLKLFIKLIVFHDRCKLSVILLNGVRGQFVSNGWFIFGWKKIYLKFSRPNASSTIFHLIYGFDLTILCQQERAVHWLSGIYWVVVYVWSYVSMSPGSWLCTHSPVTICNSDLNRSTHLAP